MGSGMSDSNSNAGSESWILEAQNVDKSFKTPRDEIHVLKGMDLRVRSGEILGIVGASGVGKSTLLHILGGLDHPNSGRILFRNVDIFSKGNSFLEKFRNKHVGFVFQMFNLLGDFTALENAMFPALIQGAEKRKARERAVELLKRIGLENRLHHKPGELSGGETQRVALARALVNRPDLVLADEPTGNLDSHASHALIELIRELNRDYNQTFVIVTHSPKVASSMDRVMELREGKVRAAGKDIIL